MGNEGGPRLGASPTHMATTVVKVDGMTCGACTSAVESAFKGLEGAGQVSVNLVMGRAVIHHDPTLLSAERVAETIEDRGFDAEVLSSDMPSAGVRSRTPQLDTTPTGPQISTTTLAVEGMTCGACTSAVEGGFKDIPGIKSMTVSLLSERAVVEHDASIITVEQVAEIIEDRGFGATVIDTKLQDNGPALATMRSDLDLPVSDVMTTIIAIEGMTCGACTSAVEGAFKDVAGLVHFNISLLAERAVISHEVSVLPTEKILELIDDAGFDAKIISTQPEGAQRGSSKSTVQLKIYGLRDSSAATTLENLLRSKAGVSSAVISLATSRANIIYNSSLTGLRAIVEAVENAGYDALVADADDNNAQLESLAKTKEIQEWKHAFYVSLSFAIPVFCISMLIPMFIPVLNFGGLVLIPGLSLGDVICCLLTIPVQFGVGKRFYISAFKSLKHGSPTMDVLVVLGTSAAFFFSVFAVIIAVLFPPHNSPGTVFDTSTMLITFITLGRYLENRAKGQTSKALSNLMSLAPSMATIYEDPLYAEKLGETFEVPGSPVDEKKATPILEMHQDSIAQTAGQRVIPTELLQVGDIVILRPGDKIPADGTVTRGESYVDESMVTGEAMPILKKKGSSVMAGTVNGAGAVDFRVTRAGKDTQLSQIVSLVQEAQTNRAPIQRLADLVAGYFVPIIILLGLITFTGWMVLSEILPHPPKIFVDQRSGGKFMVCLKLCISVIVFACPCALGLATPTAIMVGTGIGASSGILCKGGAVIETSTKITHVIFDKTGTLTMGRLSVAETRLEPTWKSNEGQRRLFWNLVGLSEMNSEHPIGRSIVEAAKRELGLGSEETISGNIAKFRVSVGNGISATLEISSKERGTYQILAGNAAYLRSKNITLPDSIPSDFATYGKSDDISALTAIHVAIFSQYAGAILLSDTLKPTAEACITAIHKMGLSTSLVTGDTYNTALSVAKAVGIPKDSIRASVSPAQKQAIVAELQAQGEIVAMVGDGINDSPALASANVGIGLASGADVAVEAADIVIMRPDDLLHIPAALCLCRTIFSRIKMNLVWACGYNFVGLPFAMGFFLPFGVMMPPMAAGAAMAVSSVSVTLSSLALKWWARPAWLTVEALEHDKGAAAVAVPIRGQKNVGKRRHLLTRALERVADLFNSASSAASKKTDRGDYVQLRTAEPPV